MSIDYSKFAISKQKKKRNKKRKEELCIMPKNCLYETERKKGLVRHEVFYGTGKRQLSIEWGLIVFLRPVMHNMSDKGIHYNKEFRKKVQQIAQKEFERRYGHKKFMEVFGKNYLWEEKKNGKCN